MQEIEQAIIEYCEVYSSYWGLSGKAEAEFKLKYICEMHNSWLMRAFIFVGSHWAWFDRFYAKGIRRDYRQLMGKIIKGG